MLLLDELALGELELGDEEDEVASVGLSPPHAASIPTPARAAPPESRTRNSRLSVSVLSSSRTIVVSHCRLLGRVRRFWPLSLPARIART